MPPGNLCGKSLAGHLGHGVGKGLAQDLSRKQLRRAPESLRAVSSRPAAGGGEKGGSCFEAGSGSCTRDWCSSLRRLCLRSCSERPGWVCTCGAKAIAPSRDAPNGGRVLGWRRVRLRPHCLGPRPFLLAARRLPGRGLVRRRADRRCFGGCRRLGRPCVWRTGDGGAWIAADRSVPASSQLARTSSSSTKTANPTAPTIAGNRSGDPVARDALGAPSSVICGEPRAIRARPPPARQHKGPAAAWPIRDRQRLVAIASGSIRRHYQE